MRSFGGLWDRITAYSNLKQAWEQFRRTHVNGVNTAIWEGDLDARLAKLRRALVDGSYRPGPYSCFKIYEPKPRLISRAPVRDRLVHNALCNYIAPLIDRRLIDQTYSCRVGYGAHRACARARELAREGGYFLKLDVRHYFQTIDWSRLEGIVLPMFRDREVKRLIRLVIENTKGFPYDASLRRGLPIGNLTSQWFANLYLDGLDHFLVEGMRLGRSYLRYMDDLLVYLPSAAECRRVHDAVRDWLAENRALELKEESTVYAPVSEGVPFLGLRIWRDRWRMQRRRFMRTRRTLERHYAAHVRGDESGWKLQEVARAMEGAIRWYGFKGVYAHVGEKTLAQYGLERSDDGLPLWEKAAGAMESVDFARFAMGGNWNNGASNASNLSAGYSGNWSESQSNNNVGFRLFSPEGGAGNAARHPSKEPSRSTCALQCGGDEHAPGDTGTSSLRASAGQSPVSPSLGNVECRMENVECGMENVECGVECGMENGEFNK
ncbi:MAG: group II intron reverse transcriptase domain-containing protein [Kiritimatiellae bacterium]|nr:group II intron reverse transcriptase domain-containing protein [Kiritimatiellia bacterium]